MKYNCASSAALAAEPLWRQSWFSLFGNRKATGRLCVFSTFCALFLAWPAAAQQPDIAFACTASPIDDWPAQLDIRDQRILCEATAYDIRIEVAGINRISSPLTGDGSHIARMFRLYQEASDTVQPVTMHVDEFSPNVLEYYLRDGNGDRITQLHRQFVWTRDFTPGGLHRRRDTVVVYGATQSFRCGHQPVNGEPGPPARCMAARTVVVCDSFHEVQPGVRGQVRYPVLTAQSYDVPSSIAMLNGFEAVAQVLEDMQTEILRHTCGGY